MNIVHANGPGVAGAEGQRGGLTERPVAGRLKLRATAGVSLPLPPPKLSIQYQIGTDSQPSLAVRGTSVCGRVTSAPLRKANWLADRLHSIGRFEGRRQSKPGKWTRWGLSECQDGEPIRTKAMGGPAGPEISGEGVPKALIRRVLTKERGVA